MLSVKIEPGTYVLAVSGGVDSMVLLDLLRTRPGVKLIVAHYDHGMRENSQQDRKLVQKVSMSHNISFEYEVASLDSAASEEVARKARYAFLRRIRKKYNAAAIITAHHQDDLLETAIINLLRGTGWRGLCSLRSLPTLQRPLLGVPKSDILAYAKSNSLKWHDDPTNADTRYLRNYVRHRVLPKMTGQERQRWIQIIVRQNDLQQQIDAQVESWLSQHARDIYTTTSLPRYQLIMIPFMVAIELLQAVMRRKGGSLERPLAAKAVLFAKTARPQKIFQFTKHWQLRASSTEVIVEPRSAVVSLDNADGPTEDQFNRRKLS